MAHTDGSLEISSEDKPFPLLHYSVNPEELENIDESSTIP